MATTIPNLGTTLPPISLMEQYFGPQGDPSHETTVPFAGRTLQINKVLADNCRALGKSLTAAGYDSYIRDVGGFRTSIGGSGEPIPYSMHQFGAAFDLNEDGGPNGDWHTMTLPRGIVSLCAQAGWFCGENWSGPSRDGGHFQFTGGKVTVTPAAVGAAQDAIGALLAGAAIPVGMVAVLAVAAILAGAAVALAITAGAAYAGARIAGGGQ